MTTIFTRDELECFVANALGYHDFLDHVYDVPRIANAIATPVDGGYALTDGFAGIVVDDWGSVEESDRESLVRLHDVAGQFPATWSLRLVSSRRVTMPGDGDAIAARRLVYAFHTQEGHAELGNIAVTVPTRDKAYFEASDAMPEKVGRDLVDLAEVVDRLGTAIAARFARREENRNDTMLRLEPTMGWTSVSVDGEEEWLQSSVKVVYATAGHDFPVVV